MTLDIGDSLEKGFEKTLNKNAAIFAGLFLLVNVVIQIFKDSMFENMLDTVGGLPQGQSALGQLSVEQLAPLSLGVSDGVAFLGLSISTLIAVLLNIGTLRGLLNTETQFKKEYFTENILWTLGNIIAGGIVFGILVSIGTVLLIVPGIFLFVSLVLWSIYVIDRNVNFLEGLKSAWRDTKGEKLRIFAVLLIVGIGGAVFDGLTGIMLSLPTTIITGLFLEPAQVSAIGSVVSLIPTGFVTVFGFAVLIDVYKQISTVEG